MGNIKIEATQFTWLKQSNEHALSFSDVEETYVKLDVGKTMVQFLSAKKVHNQKKYTTNIELEQYQHSLLFPQCFQRHFFPGS